MTFIAYLLNSGEMEEENNLIPIDYASESSQDDDDDEDMNNRYDGMSDDEELEAINRSFKSNRNKRRKIMVDSDDDDDSDKDQDDDIDINLDQVENDDEHSKNGAGSDKKLTKRQLKQMEHEKKLKARKENFFGAAKNNPVRKKKKYKFVPKSYINEKGMFVTEDVKVTDDEDINDEDINDENQDNSQKKKERVHKFQHIEYNEDDDIDMMGNKEHSVEKMNGNNTRLKNKNGMNKRKKKITPKKKKNGSITSFFKKK